MKRTVLQLVRERIAGGEKDHNTGVEKDWIAGSQKLYRKQLERPYCSW